MSAILEKYWYIVVIALLLGIVTLQHEALLSAATTITKANDAVTEWKTTANDQTTQIDKLQADSAARQQKANAAIAQAQKTASIYQKRAIQIESQTNSGDVCQNLKETLVQYMKGYQP